MNCIESPMESKHSSSSLVCRGFCVIEDVVPPRLVESALEGLDVAIEFVDSSFPHYNEAFQVGGAYHHILTMDSSFIDLLLHLKDLPILSSALGAKYVLNSFGAFVNAPEICGHRSMEFHRDIRTNEANFSQQMIVLIVPLTDVTLDNGPTEVIPGSHREFGLPDPGQRTGLPVALKAGDLLAMDGGLIHRASENTSNSTRSCLTLSFTKPYIKTQFNYLAAYEDAYGAVPTNLKQILGLYSRIPRTLSDWYSASGDYHYRGDQG